MRIVITKYNAICKLGNNIEEIFYNALSAKSMNWEVCTNRNKNDYFAMIKTKLPQIKNPDFNLRCNQLALAVLEPFNIPELIRTKGAENIAVVCATTNTGVEEYERSKNPRHAQIGNPAEFIKEFYGLKNYFTTVSTACSSGIKAFSIAKDLLKTEYANTVIVIGVDSLTKVPIYGFDSLEILSPEKSNPFSKNRKGINIGEGVAGFVLEKEGYGINILGIGETTDTYHATTPDPEAIESIRAIENALQEANLLPKDIDYINLHGTGTIANDLMEGRAINHVFGDKTPTSSTKPLTGHCLGAAASIETALCCALIENFDGRIFPHIYDGEYDYKIPKINLATTSTIVQKLNTCLCTSFGFGGTNTAIILQGENKNE